jgi:Glycosyl hydrolase family 26
VSLRVSHRKIMNSQSSRLLLIVISTFALVSVLAIWRIYFSTTSPTALSVKSAIALKSPSFSPSVPLTDPETLKPKVLPRSSSAAPNTSTTTDKPSGLPWESGVSYPNVEAYSNAAANVTSAFGAWRRRPVAVAVVWPERESWASFTQPNSFYANWAEQPYTKVFTLPLFPSNIGDTIAGCIAGDYNHYWSTFAQTMESSGLASESSIIRLGWEMNEHTDWGTPGQFAACWRNIVSTVNDIAPGLLWDWNVNRGPSADMPGDSILNAYPGDAYVNIVGVDSYDDWPPVDANGGWQQQLNGPYGLNYWLSFAEGHGKKFSVPEWGVGAIGDWNGHSGGDDPQYIKDMYDFFSTNSADMAFESYFNGDGNSIYDPTQNPNSAAEYLRLFKPASA